MPLEATVLEEQVAQLSFCFSQAQGIWREIPAFHLFTNGWNVHTVLRNINFWITLVYNSLKAKIPPQVLFDADYPASFGDKLYILFSGRSFYILAEL